MDFLFSVHLLWDCGTFSHNVTHGTGSWDFLFGVGKFEMFKSFLPLFFLHLGVFVSLSMGFFPTKLLDSQV